MRKRHFLCKEITDMQWEVTDGKVSEKRRTYRYGKDRNEDSHKERNKDILSENKKPKKGKGSLQAICKKQAESISLFLSEDPGKKGSRSRRCLLWKAALVIPLFLLGICTLLGIMDLYRVQALVKTSLHQSAQELGMYASVESGIPGEHADRSTFFRCLHRLRKSTSSGARGWRSSESDRISI